MENNKFYEALMVFATQKKYCKIQFFTEIHEFVITYSIINGFTTENGEDFMCLANGEKVRMDRIMTVCGLYSPNYAHYEEFTCDC